MWLSVFAVDVLLFFVFSKAQHYRRKSSIAMHSLMNIGTQISTLQREQEENGNGNAEEKAVEEEELRTNLLIQQQIQSAIALFQEEFGAELDEELNNIESFQYESLPELSENEDAAQKTDGAASGSGAGAGAGPNEEEEDRFEFIEMVAMGQGAVDPLHEAIRSDQFTEIQRQNTRNDAFTPSATFTPTNSSNAHFVNPFGLDFRIKFTDAHSNPADSPKPGDVDAVHVAVRNEEDSDPQTAATAQRTDTHRLDAGGGDDDDDGDGQRERGAVAVEEEEDGDRGMEQSVNVQRGDGGGLGAEDEDDALPSVFETPRGPEDEQPTPGGPDRFGMDEVENIITRQRVQEMECKLSSLSHRMLGLMERVELLTDRNQQLEISKLELIANTADAMNEYRETVRGLNLQNQRLADRLSHRHRLRT